MITSLEAALDRAAKRVPGGAALIDISGSATPMTYHEWSSGSIDFAEMLRGNDPAKPIILYFHEYESVEFAVAFFGVLRAGYWALPMSDRFSVAEVKAVQERYACREIVLGPRMRAAVTPNGLAGLMAPPDPNPGGPDAGPGYAGHVSPPGCIIYTAGTTGIPKAVLCPESDLLKWLPHGDPGCRPYVHQFPFDTTAGLSSLMRALVQYPTVRIPLLDPGAIARSLDAHHPRDIALTPAGVRAMMHASHRIPEGPASEVETVMVTSAVCTSADLCYLRDAFPKAALVNMYSSTEAGRASTIRICRPGAPVDADDPEGLIRVGRPTPWSEVRITDPEGREAVTGSQGSVWLRAKGSVRSYLADLADLADDGSARTVFHDGWVRTGDTGLLDASGELHLAGRAADTINKGGINVSALQIESVLREHPGVRDAAVVALPHETLGEEIYGAVTCSRPLDEKAVRSHVAERLGRFKTPVRVLAVPRLPVNSLGKVVKRELQAQLRERLAPAVAAAEDRHLAMASGPDLSPVLASQPTGQDEARFDQVKRIWNAVLPGSGDGSGDDFFENGGESLAAIEIATRIQQELDIQVTLFDVLENPTPDLLTGLLVSRRAGIPDERLVREPSADRRTECLSCARPPRPWLHTTLLPGTARDS